MHVCVAVRLTPSSNQGGKGSNPKTILYIGGLEDSVNDASLHAAFIPFGDIKDVSIPMDHATGKHRGFGFVQFEEKDDATAALDNMHNAELFGKVLKVNFAQPMKIKGGDKGWSHQAVWADADTYMVGNPLSHTQTHTPPPESPCIKLQPMPIDQSCTHVEAAVFVEAALWHPPPPHPPPHTRLRSCSPNTHTHTHTHAPHTSRTHTGGAGCHD